MEGEAGWIAWAHAHARRVAITVVGGTVLLVGLALLVLPGPAFVVIPVGLGILGLEFAWARRWLRTVRERAAQTLPNSWTGDAGGSRPADATAPAEEPASASPGRKPR